MKFMLLKERDERVYRTFGEFIANKWRLHGAKVIDMEDIKIIDKVTREFVKSAIVVKCEGSVISYLRNRVKIPGTIIKGWDIPKD